MAQMPVAMPLPLVSGRVLAHGSEGRAAAASSGAPSDLLGLELGLPFIPLIPKGC